MDLSLIARGISTSSPSTRRADDFLILKPLTSVPLVEMSWLNERDMRYERVLVDL
jgi:hypothetical protein